METFYTVGSILGIVAFIISCIQHRINQNQNDINNVYLKLFKEEYRIKPS